MPLPPCERDDSPRPLALYRLHCCSKSAVQFRFSVDSSQPFFRPSANKRLNKLETTARRHRRETTQMLPIQSAAYDPEELSLLGDVLDSAVAFFFNDTPTT